MLPQELPEHFAQLDPKEQARLLAASDAMCRFVYRCTTSILVAGPPGAGAGLNNGSGFILNLEGHHFLGTAWHVVQAWQTRHDAGEKVQFQAGKAVLEPRTDLIWSDEASDIAFIPLKRSQIGQIDASPIDPMRGWPPPQPEPGQYVLVSGYPGHLRQQRSVDEVDLHALSTMLQVTTSGDRYIACQFEREHWISTNWNDVPAPGTDLGGISGGPVLLVQNLVYPLVGLVSEFNASFEILYIRTLSHLPASFPDQLMAAAG